MKFSSSLTIVVISCLLASCINGTGNVLKPEVKPLLANVSYSTIGSLPYREADKTISYGKDDLQFGKLWLPSATTQQPNKNYPLVIFIHGGCWLNAYSIDHSFPLTSALAENGIMVWSLEYRRIGDEGGSWPGTFEDILLGVQHFLRQTQYTYDRSKIFLVGHSAGGHLALLAQNTLAKQNETDTKITDVIGLAAISNLTNYSMGKNSCQSAVNQFMNGDAQSQQIAYQQADPAQQLFSNDIGINRFLLHGTADSIVPLSQSVDSQFGAKIVKVEQGGHFDWLHPQSESFQVLVNQINDSGK